MNYFGETWIVNGGRVTCQYWGLIDLICAQYFCDKQNSTLAFQTNALKNHTRT